MFRISIVLVLALAMLPASAADSPDIRELMSAEEFAASGLGRLSEEEFEVVNRWLMRFSGQVVAETEASIPVMIEDDAELIISRIDGQFTGWNGPTRFPLKNGQVWETNSTRRYSYNAIDPEVEIKRNWIGSYRMRIVETGKLIYVKRIE